MTRNALKILAWMALAAIVVVTVSPIELRPRDFLPVDVDRALAFAILTSLFVFAYPRHALLVGAAIVIGAGLIELLQMLSPSRHARFDDALVKASGALCALIVTCGIRQVLDVMRQDFKRHMVKARTMRFKASPGPRPSVEALDAMTPLAVNSRMIDAIYFSQDDGCLRIRMKNGEERLFEGVSTDIALDMAAAPSPGQYYLEKIRPNYRRLAA
jgi:VanZ family protein